MNPPLHRTLLVAAGLTAALAGCSGGDPVPASSATTTAAAVVPTTAPHAVDVEFVLTRLADVGATAPTVNTETDDPNKLLGRPGGYTARASFALPGGGDREPHRVERGGVVEIWSDAEGARQRSEHIQRTLKDTPILGTEYHYLAGPVLVRVSGEVTPETARRVESGVAALPR